MVKRQVKTTNYFSHDSSARNDEKVIRLRMKHNAAGYGVYFMILERLREEIDYMSAKDYNMIAFDLRVDAALVKSVVEDFGLFDFTDDGKFFYSESFKNRMGMKDAVKKVRSEAGKKGNVKRWKDTSVITDDETPSTKKPAPSTTSQYADNDKCLQRFFRKDNQSNIEVILMNFGMKPDDMPKLRKLAKEVVAEWKVSDKHHNDYTDWSQHLIATMRIKLQAQQKQPTKGKQDSSTEQPPQQSDYKFNGGFGGKDV